MPRAARTFIFYHHESFGPFSLEELRDGEARFGGSVGRLRLLFSLARRGHSVWLVGNVHSGSCDGVMACSAPQLRAFAPPSGKVTLVFNNPPPEDEWRIYASAPWSDARTVIWAGNHVGPDWVERLAARKLDRIVCVSRWHREEYRTRHGFERLEVSYSGIDKDFLAPRNFSEPDTVLSLSVPRRSKGIDRLLSAWRLVKQRHPPARLWISGASSMHDPLAPLGKTGILDADIEREFPEIFGGGSTSLSEHGIELLGSRSLPEVHQALSRVLFAVVNPSHSSPETYCRSAVEAQAAGVALVGARSGALQEVVADGRTGLLYRDDRPEALADAMLRLLQDPALTLDMGKHGPAWSNWIADYELIAPDWEFIANRAETDEPAPCVSRPVEDRLRALGYGSARSWLSATIAPPARQLIARARRITVR